MLQVFNTTLSPITMPVTGVVVPASLSNTKRGPGVNVTSECRPNLTVDPANGVTGGLTAANYTSIAGQAGLEFVWVGQPKYLTTNLTVQSSAGGSTIASTSVLKGFVMTPATKSATAVHAAYAGNAANIWTGAFTNPDVGRNLIVTFAASWDGGDIVVTGTDALGAAQTETFLSNAGSTRVGVKIFATVTGATKSAIGVTANTASIGTGDTLGPAGDIADSFGVLSVDNVVETSTVSATNNSVIPTTLPNGSRVYRMMVNVNHTHTI
jgi:hypothetical protein